MASLKKLGFETVPSETNFIMIDVRRDVRPLIGAMRTRGVHVGRVFPAMPHHMRVTIGKPEQMEAFVRAFARGCCVGEQFYNTTVYPSVVRSGIRSR